MIQTQFFLYVNFKKNNILTTLVKKIKKSDKYILKTLRTVSSGGCGFKNKQKKTPFACIFIIRKIILKKPIHIIFKGDSFYKNLVLDLIKREGTKIVSISEVTNIPYNGCKYSKKYK